MFVNYISKPLDVVTFHFFHLQVRLSPKSGKACGPVEEVTCGGNALGFYAAVRLRLTRMGLLNTEDEVISVSSFNCKDYK